MVYRLKTEYWESMCNSHAIRQDEGEHDWILFEQTRFLYVFFSFNMMYNVDWEKSSKQLSLAYHPSGPDSGVSETWKINEMVKFCCGRGKTKTGFLRQVFEILATRHSSWDEIMDGMRGIEPDERITPRLINEFNDALYALGQDLFDYQNVHSILQLIYNVRCNIFHGLKTFELLAYDSQQKRRIIIYTDLLAAFIQVVFTRLDLDFQVRIDESSLRELYHQLPKSEAIRERLKKFIV